MEGPIDEESTEPERNDATMRSTVRRKGAAKRTYPWLPAAAEDEDTPVAKMPRLWVPFPANAANAEEYVTKTASSDAKEIVPPAYADANPMMAMQPNASATQAPPSVLTLVNDIELKHNKFAAVAQRPVPTNMHLGGWHPNMYQTNEFALMNMWTSDQANILQILNGMNGYANTVALGPGQTTSQSWNGWNPRGSAWQPTISHLTGMRTTDQGNIPETQQNGTNWYAGQTTTIPCRNRLHKTVDTPVDRTSVPTGRWTTEEVAIDWTTERKGKWTAEEDDKLLRAAEKFSVTRWKAIAALIPGRSKKQCWNRWQYALDPSIVRMTERTGKWLTEEDVKLVDAVAKHNGKNWDEIAMLVPSRTKRQCMDRWHKVLDTSVC
jgi:hypothetical protein